MVFKPSGISAWLARLLPLCLVFAGTVSAQAAELREIQERGYLVVGIKDNLPPLGFRDTGGELQGLEIDLAHWLAQQLLGDADAVQFQPLTNADRLPALLNDTVDLVIARLSVTESRMRVVDFSSPYYLDGTAFITNQPALQTLADLRQSKIAVLERSDTIAIVRSALPTAQLVGVASYEQAKMVLETGQVSAFAADVTVLTGWVQADPQTHLLSSLISADALAVAMPRGLQYDDLRHQINQAIEAWQTQGVLRQRILYWNLPEAGLPAMELAE